MSSFIARQASSACRLRYKFGFASLAALALTSVAPSAAYAQADDDEDQVLEEIVTTGTRLKANPNLASAVPVLSVTGEEAAVRGNVRVEDFVNVLPQVFANQASEVSNAASGTASLNLRGLGRNRTVVMIDGRRLPYRWCLGGIRLGRYRRCRQLHPQAGFRGCRVRRPVQHRLQRQ